MIICILLLIGFIGPQSFTQAEQENITTKKYFLPEKGVVPYDCINLNNLTNVNGIKIVDKRIECFRSLNLNNITNLLITDNEFVFHCMVPYCTFQYKVTNTNGLISRNKISVICPIEGLCNFNIIVDYKNSKNVIIQDDVVKHYLYSIEGANQELIGESV
jgi:hypothetical protein